MITKNEVQKRAKEIRDDNKYLFSINLDSQIIANKILIDFCLEK